MKTFFYAVVVLAIMGYALKSYGVFENYFEKEPKYTDYKEACEQGNFKEAYIIVDRLKKEMLDFESDHGYELGYHWDSHVTKLKILKQKYEDARHYVILRETSYLLEHNGLDALPQIAFTVKENDASWVYKDLISIAISLGDEELEQRLRKLSDID